MRALAVDVGATHVGCALIEDRRILAAKSLAVDDRSELARVLPAIEAALRGFSITDCAGLAMSFPGIVDPRSGRILSTPAEKYTDSTGLDLAAWCKSAFRLPFHIENDARAALLGETYAGAAQGVRNVVMTTLGGGVGGACMTDGRLLHGAHLQAGCLGGHLPVLFNGRKCICGALGCVEAEASTWALPEICRAWPGFESSALAREPRLDFEALFRCGAAGDATALAVRDRCLHVWAAGAVGLVHAYDPEMMIFGGSVMKSGGQILPFIEAYVHRHAWTPWGKVAVRAAALGSEAALLGAIPMIEAVS